MANLGNLIVSGTARFLNEIKGKIDWSNVLNKPTFGTASAKDVPSSGNASASQVVMGNDSRLTDARTPSSHTHGNIQNGGTLQTSDITIANGDKLVVTDSSDSSKVARTSVSFDGSTTTKALTPKGTFETFAPLASPALTGTPTAPTATAGTNTTQIATTAFVKTAIDNLPEPMIFKGSVGTGGTITSLPTAAASNEGYTYKVITAMSSPVTAKVGDTVISNGSTWVVIPSGDEPSGTVTSVAVSNGGGLSVSGSPITSSGTITVSHADTSSQASVNNSGRTYIQDITLDTYGHVTGIASATETVTNTWRPINLDGGGLITDSTTALDLISGNNVTIEGGLGSDLGKITISATDTKYESKAAASGGTAVSLVTTGEKYTWNSKTSNTGTVTSVAVSGGTSGISVSGSPITTSGTITLGINGSTVINNLSEGASPAQRTDYIVAQYAGGGTTTTTYHRRSLANIFAALNSSDITTALGFTPTSNTGTVTSVATGAGLTGGTITSTGTLKANIKSETKSTLEAADMGSTASRQYAVGLDKNGKLSVNVPWENTQTVSSVAGKTGAVTLTASDVGALASSTKYAGASTAGGAATSAAKLTNTSKVGDTNKPVYFTASGVPSACSYELNKSVPSNAVFTDTLYVLSNGTGDDIGKIILTPSTGDPYKINVYPDWSNISSKPTSLGGYGITDAKIESGTITLGTNTITPLTSNSTLNAAKLSGTIPSVCYTDTNNAVTQTATSTNADYEVLFSATADNATRTEGARKYSNFKFNPSTGTVTATKFVGDISGGTGLTSSQVTTALGFTPPSSDTNTHRPIKLKGTQILGNNTTALDFAEGSNITLSNSSGTITIAATDTTYESKTAASGGTDISLCTTGEKYTWNNKLDTAGGTISGNLTVQGTITQTGATSLTSGTDTATNTQAVVAKNKWGKVYLDAHYESTRAASYYGVNAATSYSDDDQRIIWRTGAQNSPTYLGGYVDSSYNSFVLGGSSGARWDTVPVTSATGVTEIGKYLDFHATDGDTTNFTYRLTNTGDGACTYSGTWTKASSRKIKENIEDMDLDEAKEIFNLRPVQFDYKEGFGKKNQRGLIAEEVAKVLPTLVIDEVGEEGTEEWCPASVDYIGAVPYLIKIVQEQQKEIDELKAKVG